MFGKLSNSNVQGIRRKIDRFMLLSSMLCALFILFLIGYNTNAVVEVYVLFPIKLLIYVFDLLLLSKIITTIYFKKPEKLSFYSEIILFLYLTLIIIARIYPPAFSYLDLDALPWLYVGVYAVFIVELSKTSLVFDKFYFNPTLLFVASFLFLILLGTILLLMPKSTVGMRLTVLDALFMSTSAVCVTGLSVTDISTNFTTFGQNVILILIQLGGLGIMTFTGFFGYFFTGGFSYKNQLMFTEFLNESKVGSVIRTLYTIVGITFLCEGIGAVLIFFSLDAGNFNDVGERIHFSIFHAISGFCNAGFSTLSYGLYDKSVRFNYNLQIIIALLIIVGGLGFALVHNTYRFFNRWY
ncbi:MAG TPA: potassium transporter TrkG, partial [Sphingobacteriaceae bacterium]